MAQTLADLVNIVDAESTSTRVGQPGIQQPPAVPKPEPIESPDAFPPESPSPGQPAPPVPTPKLPEDPGPMS